MHKLSYWHGLLNRNKTIEFFQDVLRRAVDRLKNEVIKNSIIFIESELAIMLLYNTIGL